MTFLLPPGIKGLNDTGNKCALLNLTKKFMVDHGHNLAKFVANEYLYWKNINFQKLCLSYQPWWLLSKTFHNTYALDLTDKKFAMFAIMSLRRHMSLVGEKTWNVKQKCNTMKDYRQISLLIIRYPLKS